MPNQIFKYWRTATCTECFFAAWKPIHKHNDKPREIFMKYIFSILAVVALAFLLAACDSDDHDHGDMHQSESRQMLPRNTR